MLRITDLTYAIEGRPLLDSASAFIPKGHKVGLIGRNGAGKTTLFRLIHGELQADGGEIATPAGARIGGVAQEAPAGDESLLETVLAADVERARLLEESETATDPGRIADIQTRLTDIDAWSAEARAATILNGMGFDHAQQQMPCRAFSGGWRMRVALAAVLFAEPDVLLLDEPTNYLDLEGALWLESYLAKYPHTVVVISHDRDLLNRVVNGILHLEDRKLAFYAGNYDQFARQRALDQVGIALRRRGVEADRGAKPVPLQHVQHAIVADAQAEEPAGQVLEIRVIGAEGAAEARVGDRPVGRIEFEEFDMHEGGDGDARAVGPGERLPPRQRAPGVKIMIVARAVPVASCLVAHAPASPLDRVIVANPAGFGERPRACC